MKRQYVNVSAKHVAGIATLATVIGAVQVAMFTGINAEVELAKIKQVESIKHMRNQMLNISDNIKKREKDSAE